ncbi:hypothetical protein B0H16DRAFT_1711221 [Mycena metata]|uniref:RING-type domain-containing protein n=1 Tax=Mycena metata TaxID=1033252 RepID=A0AAD7NYD9_9AGAR|nr:hypothetical protein B0H16DRAFT_1711221 [Mycena metata]
MSKKTDLGRSAGTIHAFFSSVEPEPGIRRPLNMRTPPARKKASTAGMTNALTPISSIEGPDRMRRLRPSSISTMKTLKRPPSVAFPGSRVARAEPLTVEDLWRPGPRPPSMECHVQDHCTVCLQLLSHPVFYTCGHGHCYTCVRVWLEESWTCPQCDAVITQPPFHIAAVDGLLARAYREWDGSVVPYSWDGLTFPVVAGANV